MDLVVKDCDTAATTNELVEQQARINHEFVGSGSTSKRCLILLLFPVSGMIYLAMDVSKNTLVFYAESLGQTFTVPNTFEEVQRFLTEHAFPLDQTLVGCESTGDFHIQPCLAALDLGYRVKVLNPLLTRQVINATIRKKKTDASDAEIIAQLLQNPKHGTLVTQESFQQTKRTILRTEHTITRCASDLKRVLHTLKEKSKSMNVDQAIVALEHCIKTLESESDGLVASATSEQSHQEELLDSVPGCGAKLAAIISTEAGDITRFPTSRQFKAYVGIDPKISQSGDVEIHGRMTKRGNPILRHALFLAANVARRCDPELKAFYEKKRSEGKKHTHAVCVIERKLCERIYAIVSKNILYHSKTISP